MIEGTFVAVAALVAVIALLLLSRNSTQTKALTTEERRDFLKGLFVAGSGAAAMVLLEDTRDAETGTPTKVDAQFTEALFVTQVPTLLFFNGRLMRPSMDDEEEEMDYFVQQLSDQGGVYRIDFEFKIKAYDLVGLVYFLEGHTGPEMVWVQATQNVQPRWQRNRV